MVDAQPKISRNDRIVAELELKLGKGEAGYRYTTDRFIRALGWYEGARDLEAAIKLAPTQNHEKNIQVLKNQLEAIIDNGETFEQLHAQFSSFGPDDFKYIKNKLFQLA